MWMRFICLALVVVGLAQGIDIPNLNGPAHYDRVLSLPNMTDFKFGAYSGYLDVTGTGKALHYYFVESQGSAY